MARGNNTASNPGTSEARDSNGKPRRNKHKRRKNGDNAEDTAVNAGFSGSKSGQRKKPFKNNNSGPSSLDRILDRPCQIHGTPGTPANHTNRECWVFKQVGRSGAKNKDKGSQSDDGYEEPRSPNTGGQKKFPPQIQTVNVVNTTQIPNPDRIRTLRDADLTELVVPQYKLGPVTFNRTDRPVNANQGNPAALVLDPIIDGFHLTRVLMDGGSSLNLLYQDTVRKMGIDHSMIKPTKATFKGIIPGVEASCTGSIALEVVFGSPENYRTEELIFEIVPFRSDYQALLGRTAFARFNAVPHYAYRKLKMPGPRGVITVNGRAELSLGAEDYTTALTAEATSGIFQSNLESMVELPGTVKGVRTTSRQDSPARPMLN